MKKFFLLLMLIILIGSLLFFQWKEYSTSNAKEIIDVKQTLTLSYGDKGLIIEQSIENIPASTYMINIPKDLSNFQCYINEKEICVFGSDNSSLLLNDSEVTFTYNYPFSQQDQSILLENWSVSVQGLPISTTRVKISDSKVRKGSWISTADLLAFKKMELLDYYVFESAGKAPLLYWQREKLIKTTIHDSLNLFSSTPLNDLDLLQFNKNDHKNTYIVISKLHKEVEEEPFYLINSKEKLKQIEAKLLMNNVEGLLSTRDEEKWLAGVVTSVMINRPIGEEKAKQMYNELINKLSEQELKLLKDKLFSLRDDHIHSNKLDEYLGEAVRFKTNFFSKNTNIKAPLYPLLKFDARELKIRGEIEENIHIIHENEKVMIEFEPLLKELGYEVQMSDQRSLNAVKGKINYHFYPNEKFFELNQKKYRMTHTPILLIEDQIYVEMNVLNTLFNVTLSENEQEIQIK